MKCKKKLCIVRILKLLGNNSISQTNEENQKISELLENFQKFSADEQNELIASFKRIESGELTDEELEDVVGGRSAYTPKQFTFKLSGFDGFAAGGSGRPKIPANSMVSWLFQYNKLHSGG